MITDALAREIKKKKNTQFVRADLRVKKHAGLLKRWLQKRGKKKRKGRRKSKQTRDKSEVQCLFM